ncbi:MAG: PD-(D/E)XK nuclease family protein [Bacteroidota bacterium]
MTDKKEILKVLIVDDEIGMCSAAERALKNFVVHVQDLDLFVGFEATIVHSAEDYRQILKNNKAYYTDTEYIQLVEDCEKDAKALEALIKLTDELSFIINDRYKHKEFTLEDYTEKLKTAASAARFQIKEKHGYGVTITSIEQTRGIPYKALILSGAVDGELPIAYTPERFLGKELDESEDRHLRSERLQFYQFLTNAYDFDLEQKNYYIFYPKTDNEKELVISPFINSLLMISNNTIVTDLSRARQDSGLKAQLPWLDAVISKPGIMEYTGKTVLDDIKVNEYEHPLFSDDFKKLNEEASNYLRSLQKKNKGIIHDKDHEDTFSVSRLESYASCPYKYFSESLLKLEKKEEKDTFLSALDKGSIMHEILHLFYERLQQDIYATDDAGTKKLKPVKLDPFKKEDYLELLKAIATRVIKLYEFDHPFFKLEMDDIFGSDDKQGILEFWLTEELNRIRQGWPLNPALFEYSFGLPHDNRDAVEIGNGLKIRGKIDRIELDENHEEFLIADYKLSAGSLKLHKDIKNGRAFQIPVYIKAAEKLLHDEYGINAINKAAAYYNLTPAMENNKPVSAYFQLATAKSGFKDYNSRKSSQFCKDENEKAEMITSALDKALEIYRNINQGRFPVEPADKEVCQHCSFHPVCRIRLREPFSGNEAAGEDSSDG